MNKLKKIYCLGTSHTAGGGFEIDSTWDYRRKIITEHYGFLNKKTQHDFAYSSHLKELLNNVEVINLGKNGFGNEKMYREAHKIIEEYGFDNDSTLFLIEFSEHGRKEVFHNQFQEHIVLNYYYEDNSSRIREDMFSNALSYFYHTDNQIQIIKEEEEFFLEYCKKTLNFDVVSEDIKRNNDFFLSYLNQNNIKYLFTSTPLLSNYDVNRTIEMGDGLFFNKNLSYSNFSQQNKMTITDETAGGYDDGHPSYIIHRIYSKVVYNKLIELNYIKGNKLDIDYRLLKHYLSNNKLNDLFKSNIF